jgi:hypothetical protein
VVKIRVTRGWKQFADFSSPAGTRIYRCLPTDFSRPVLHDLILPVVFFKNRNSITSVKKSLPDTLRSINNPYSFGKIFFNPYQQDVGSPEIREPEIPDNSRILIISFSTYIRKRAALTSADF